MRLKGVNKVEIKPNRVHISTRLKYHLSWLKQITDWKVHRHFFYMRKVYEKTQESFLARGEAITKVTKANKEDLGGVNCFLLEYRERTWGQVEVTFLSHASCPCKHFFVLTTDNKSFPRTFHHCLPMLLEFEDSPWVYPSLILTKPLRLLHPIKHRHRNLFFIRNYAKFDVTSFSIFFPTMMTTSSTLVLSSSSFCT